MTVDNRRKAIEADADELRNYIIKDFQKLADDTDGRKVDVWIPFGYLVQFLRNLVFYVSEPVPDAEAATIFTAEWLDITKDEINGKFGRAQAAVGIQHPAWSKLVSARSRSLELVRLLHETAQDKTRDQGELAKAKKAKTSKAVEILLGVESKAILAVVNNGKSVDDRMREICRLDIKRCFNDSTQWAELLGVTTAAVRQTQFWRLDRKKSQELTRR